MKRRTIGLTLVTLSLLFAPLAAHAREAARAYRIGILGLGPPPAEAEWQHSPFVQGLRELGYVEGQNLVFERRYAAGRVERLADLAAELVRLQIDVIVTAFEAPILAAKRADLLVEQPSKLAFVLNLKTAKALGLTIPPAILLQATEVIQ